MRCLKRKMLLWLLPLFLLLLAAAPGSQDDPLVTAGWVEQYVNQQADKLESRLDVVADTLDGLLVVRLWIGTSYMEQNGEQKPLDAAPYVTASGRSYLPLRALGEAVGAEFKWNSEQKRVTCLKDGTELALRVGGSTIMLNGKAQTIDAPPEIVNGRVFVPVRVVGENLGFAVNWLSAEKMVVLTY